MQDGHILNNIENTLIKYSKGRITCDGSFKTFEEAFMAAINKVMELTGEVK